jgi:hypothetical protein
LVEQDFVNESLPKPLVDQVGDELQFYQPHQAGKLDKVQVDSRMHLTMALAQKRRNESDNTPFTTSKREAFVNDPRLERALALQKSLQNARQTSELGESRRWIIRIGWIPLVQDSRRPVHLRMLWTIVFLFGCSIVTRFGSRYRANTQYLSVRANWKCHPITMWPRPRWPLLEKY